MSEEIAKMDETASPAAETPSDEAPADRQTPEAGQAAQAERTVAAERSEHDRMVEEVAARYDGPDFPARLKALCVKFEIAGRERVEAAAGIIGLKKGEALPARTEAQPLKPDSGLTSGGGGLSDEEKLSRRYPTMKK